MAENFQDAPGMPPLPPEEPKVALNPKLAEKVIRLVAMIAYWMIAGLLVSIVIPLLAATQYVLRLFRGRPDPKVDATFEWVTEYLVEICDYLSFKTDSFPWPLDEPEA